MSGPDMEKANFVLTQEGDNTGLKKDQIGMNNEIKRAYAEGGGIKAIKDAADRKIALTPTSEARVDQALAKIFGREYLDRKAQGNLNQQEQDAVGAIERAHRFVTGNKAEFFDAQGNLRNPLPPEAQQLVQDFDAIASQWPEAKAILDALAQNGTKMEAIAKILADPNMAKKVNELLKGKLEGKPGEVAEALINKFNESQKTLQAEQKKQNELATKLSQVVTDRTTFDETANPPSQELVDWRDLDGRVRDLRIDLPMKQDQARDINDALRKLQTELNVSKAQNPGGNFQAQENQINNLKAQVTAIKGEIQRGEADIQRYQELTTRKQAATQENYQTLQDEKDAQDKVVENAQHAFDKAKFAKEDAEQDVALQRDEFVKGVQGVMGEAMEQYLIDKEQAYEKARTEHLEAEKSKADNNLDKFMDDQAIRRHKKTQTMVKRFSKIPVGEKIVVDKDSVGPEFQALLDLKNDGSMKVMEMWLKGYKDEKGHKLTATQIKDLLANEDFVNKHRSKVVETVVRRQLQAGRITKDQADFLAELPWAENVIKEQFDKNKESVKGTAELMGKGAVGPEDYNKSYREFKDAWKQKGGKLSWGAFVLALFSSMGGAIPA